MTNEQIVLLIRSGQPDKRAQRPLHEVLYLQNEKLIKKLANAYSYATGLEFDDLAQEGYLCMLAAVSAFDPDAGYRFTTYLANALKWRYTGLRRGLHDHVSLDQGLSFDDEMTMYDMIPDEKIDLEGDTVEGFFMSEVGQDLKKAIEALSDGDRRVLWLRYYKNMPYKEIALVGGYRDVNAAGYAIQRAIDRLRRSRILKPWQNYFSDQVAAAAYHHIGVAGYQRTGLSSTEKAAYKDMGVKIYD